MADAAPKLLRGLLEVFVLESLEQRPKHGYALLKEMGEAFGQQPNRNRLYPLLAKLTTEGYIRELSESGGNRTLYTLTDAGRESLQAYRRLPPAFRHAVRRIWGVETHPDAAPPRASEDEDEEADEEDETTAPPAPPAPVAVPVQVARPALAVRPAAPVQGAPLPYPCEEARVGFERSPRTGQLAIQLTGCPMGAYDYCPQCPVYDAVQAMRKLAFPE